MSNAKDLSLKNLQADSSKFFKKVEKTITSKSGQQYKVVFKENIKNTEVAELFTEMVKRIDYCNKNNIQFNYLSVFMYGVFNCCLDLPKINRKTIEAVIKAEEMTLNELNNLGLYEALIEEIGEEKINGISDMITSANNKEMLSLLNNEQVKNFLLHDEVVFNHEEE